MGQKNTGMKRLILTPLALLILQLSPAAHAGDKENRIIDKAIAAYGGTELHRLSELTYSDNIIQYGNSYSGHAAQGAMSTHIDQHQIKVWLDLDKNKKLFKRATTKLVGNPGSNRTVTTHRFFADDQGYSVDHCLQKYNQVGWMNFANADAGFSQTLDPLIVKQLYKDREKAEWSDTAFIHGHAHDVLKVNKGTKAEYSVYLDRNSGYLSRMTKNQDGIVKSYDYLNHDKKQGVVWAKELFVSTEEQPLYQSNHRTITIGAIDEAEFKVPTNYQVKTPGKFIDVSKMTIRQISKGVYFVGQGWGYTLFVDVGDSYVSAGAWQESPSSGAWSKSLKLLRETTGNNKPISQHIVTHHHVDHMAGLEDIVELGVDLVIHPNDISAVNQHLKRDLPDGRFIPIDKTTYLAEGKLMLFDLPNSHAAHNLVMYLPDSKILFSEDMFGSSFEKQFHSPNSWPSLDTYERLNILADKVKELELDIEQYVSSHHVRVLNQTEIDEARTLSCPSQKELKKRLFF